MYKLTRSPSIIRLHDGALIPADKDNIDYQEYLSWVNGGNTPEPVDEQPTQSRNDIEQLRLRAYADPLTGSDRHFNEAIRMQAMGESGWETVRQRGITRFEEIQQQFPWPA